MDFQHLVPSQLVRVPRMHAVLGEPPPPVVRVEYKPTECPSFRCTDWDLITREIESGAERIYHRPPDFQVEVITPALEQEKTG